MENKILKLNVKCPKCNKPLNLEINPKELDIFMTKICPTCGTNIYPMLSH